eukprot:3647574-Alexandrium_andersonii.AAC.1
MCIRDSCAASPGGLPPPGPPATRAPATRKAVDGDVRRGGSTPREAAQATAGNRRTIQGTASCSFLRVPAPLRS